MDTARLYSLLQRLIRQEEALVPLLIQLRDALKSGDRSAAAAAFAGVADELRGAPSNQFVPSWRRAIDNIGGRNLYGRELLRRITAIVEEPSYHPDHAALLIEAVNEDVDALIRNARRLDAAFEAVGLERDLLPIDACEIGALYPPTVFHDLEDFAKEVHELDRHLRALAELAGTAQSLELRRLETGSFDIFALADVGVGSVIAAVLFGVAKLLREFAEISKLRAETKKISAEAAAILAKQGEERRDAARQQLKQDVMAHGATLDEGRRNELSISVPQAIAFIETRVQMNVIFEVRASTLNEHAKETLSTEAVDAVDEILRHGNALAAVDEQHMMPLLADERSKLEV